ncbi:MAG: dGTP triphosphohydrolase, partial [Candidatus Cloacimonas sp.]|nr:dGTP triphosphohydrolase [Candidatus Cloacimonadota bacterium]
TFQVRDGIISHDGEVHNTRVAPNRDKTEADIIHYIKSRKDGKHVDNWFPATLEGCVVRFSDTIAYIGQDIEDAVRLNILKIDELPEDCTNYLGNTNSDIVDTLIKNVVLNSFQKDYISFDEETSFYLKKLKDFNYERIYQNDEVKIYNEIIYRTMGLLFEKYIDDIKKDRQESKIFKQFLENKDKRYMESHSEAEKARDFIATMTDRYFNEEAKDYLIPWK